MKNKNELLVKCFRLEEEVYISLLNLKEKSKYSWNEFLKNLVGGAENIPSQPVSTVPKMYYKSNTNVLHTFRPPTYEEVKEYCFTRNNQVDAQAFIDFYESKGWMIGKNKMKSWEAAIRTWEKNQRMIIPKNIIITNPNL